MNFFNVRITGTFLGGFVFLKRNSIFTNNFFTVLKINNYIKKDCDCTVLPTLNIRLIDSPTLVFDALSTP